MPAPPSTPRPSAVIEASWRRCLRDYRLDPLRLPSVDVMTPGELRRRAESLEALLPAARAVIPELSRALGNRPHVVLLAAADGTVLHRLGSVGGASPASEAAISPGACWDERRQGTNGIGTSIASGMTACVHLSDHFSPENAWLSCTSTPIRTPSGTTTAALNVTLLGELGAQQSQLVEYCLGEASRRIEDAFLLSQYRRSWVVRLTERAELVGLGAEAMLAVGEDGRIAGANAAARRMFAKRAESPIGRSLNELLGLSLDELMARGAEAATSGVDGWAGRVFASVRTPLRTLLRTRAAEPARSAPAAEPRPRATPLTLSDVAGDDAALGREIERLRRFLDRKVPIVIGGETGTGKEVLARAIHRESARRGRAFVAINCGALPESLIESELFGYAEGAFTGASRRGYPGKILQADGGTLFLDEIGDMPPLVQIRLLRVIAEGEVAPLGTGRITRVDLSIVCASNRDLDSLVEAGSFRADLLHRLRGAAIELPPLRARSDRAALIDIALQLEAEDLGVHASLSPEAARALDAYSWPGNIRELRYTMRACILASTDGVVTLADLPGPIRHRQASVGSQQPAPRESRESSEAAQPDPLLQVLRRHGWRVAAAARELGISRQALYRRMNRRSLVPPNRADAERLS
ncbi:MAG: sigma-54-dependent Fis family transcriptional regulator [Acetobacteraceae bacterium]|nr:sigma-54-dependent Fis family transcriptional regulator [Acetobacteraceae bacterium]